ncbi:aquaporin SIP2-1-like [Zingiber officinale]|uniref:aquaporin SIP2-1-like n=1 Tax=Zingiber officinale TaxID=94328 RepID=UPI001C4C4C2C|nr:aquaporin SIP2-1-like [Zingiber officinale]
MGRRACLIVCDAAMSFAWVWAGALVKLLIRDALGLGHRPVGEALRLALSVAYMFVFAGFARLTRGAAYNPLTVLSYAFSGGPDGFFFTALGRIPAQVIGSVIGVKLIREIFPTVGHGPHLSIDIHRGAWTEGLLTFVIVMVSQMLKKKDTNSFFMNTWISSISKLTLHILGSDLTGGVMNPASAFGWAFARGDHIRLEHLIVYWFAPVQATLLGVWTFKLLTGPNSKQLKAGDHKDKSE